MGGIIYAGIRNQKETTRGVTKSHCSPKREASNHGCRLPKSTLKLAHAVMTLNTFEPGKLIRSSKNGDSLRRVPFHSTKEAPKPLSNMSKWMFKKLRGKKKKKKLLPTQVIFKKITPKQKQQYQRYLKSSQWREKRNTALEFYGNRCGLCGSRYDLEIHHRHYDNIFKEKIEDLMILCETCHRKHHQNQLFKNGKESKYMRNPKYDTEPVTYYPKRSVNSQSK